MATCLCAGQSRCLLIRGKCANITTTAGVTLWLEQVEVNGYRDIIRHPMDLGTMKRKLSAGKYTNIDDFHRDILLIFDNCIEFNGKDADYGQVSCCFSIRSLNNESFAQSTRYS